MDYTLRSSTFKYSVRCVGGGQKYMQPGMNRTSGRGPVSRSDRFVAPVADIYARRGSNNGA